MRTVPGKLNYIKLPGGFNRYMQFMGFLGMVSSLLEREVGHARFNCGVWGIQEKLSL